MLPLLLVGGLSLRVRLSCSATVSTDCCFDISLVGQYRKSIGFALIITKTKKGRFSGIMVE
jgi:hypothetical protein